MLVVRVTRPLIYQAVAKQMAWLAKNENLISAIIDRQDLSDIDEDILELAAPVVERFGGQLTRADVEVGNCGFFVLGFDTAETAIEVARALNVALCMCGLNDDVSGIKIPYCPKVCVYDIHGRIPHEPDPKQRRRIENIDRREIV